MKKVVISCLALGASTVANPSSNEIQHDGFSDSSGRGTGLRSVGLRLAEDSSAAQSEEGVGENTPISTTITSRGEGRRQLDEGDSPSKGKAPCPPGGKKWNNFKKAMVSCDGDGGDSSSAEPSESGKGGKGKGKGKGGKGGKGKGGKGGGDGDE